jgi:hypothetical protein
MVLGKMNVVRNSMKRDASPSSLTFRISSPARPWTALGPVVGAALLLGSACGDAESRVNDARENDARESEMRPAESSNPGTSAPAAGQATTNTESSASGPAPALDDTGATGSAAAAATGADAASPIPSPADASAPVPDEIGDAGSPPVTDPSTDENLVFILQDGFQTTYFVSDCRSIAEDGTVVEAATNGGALPVGGGFTLECNLESFPSRATTDVLSASNEPWCAFGELQSFQTGGDERLTATVVTPPDVAPATLIATVEGEPIRLTQAAVFGALVWPVWIEASYDVSEVARAEQGRLCDEIFGL